MFFLQISNNNLNIQDNSVSFSQNFDIIFSAILKIIGKKIMFTSDSTTDRFIPTKSFLKQMERIL
jgi:hypothetical protein